MVVGVVAAFFLFVGWMSLKPTKNANGKGGSDADTVVSPTFEKKETVKKPVKKSKVARQGSDDSHVSVDVDAPRHKIIHRVSSLPTTAGPSTGGSGSPAPSGMSHMMALPGGERSEPNGALSNGRTTHLRCMPVL
jgi:hypothetical protein